MQASSHIKPRKGLSLGLVKNDKGQVLTFMDRTGYWCEYEYDAEGTELSYQNSLGITRKKETQDEKICC